MAALALPLSVQTADDRSNARETAGEMPEGAERGETEQDFGVAAPTVGDAASAGSVFTTRVPSTDDLQERVKTLLFLGEYLIRLKQSYLM